MKKSMLTLLITAFLALGCNVSNDTAQEVLADEGYHDIQLTGHAWFGCSDDDTFSSTFTAQRWILSEDGSQVERRVEGTLCCGYFKDCTIRH